MSFVFQAGLWRLHLRRPGFGLQVPGQLLAFLPRYREICGKLTAYSFPIVKTGEKARRMNKGKGRTTTPAWMMTATIWMLTMAPVILGGLIAALVGGIGTIPIGVVIGLVIGVASKVFATRVVQAAKRYEQNRQT